MNPFRNTMRGVFASLSLTFCLLYFLPSAFAISTSSWGAIADASKRFLVLQNYGGEAVLDRETGLVWQKSPSDQTTEYDDAVRKCRFATTGGRMGWRLPTAEELLSLRTPEQGLEEEVLALPPGHPFVGVNVVFPYFSVTKFSVGPDAESMVMVSFNKKCNNQAVVCFSGQVRTGYTARSWCVRGGPGPMIAD